VIEAESPKKAIHTFEAHKESIDLVLADIVMPEGGGSKMVDKIVQLKPGIKTIFMSGYAEDEIVHDEVFKIQHSSAAFIKKPFSAREIGSIIRQQLDS